jgi:hypothetical protein
MNCKGRYNIRADWEKSIKEANSVVPSKKKRRNKKKMVKKKKI